jgi:2-amino-4-hydroxy-6-hydroxymethyldihydropteridine diphosphokinase
MRPEALAAVPPCRAFIGMGGNLGDVRAHLKAALAGMQALPGTQLEAVSSLYQTKPVDATGPDYLNAVAVLQTALGPHELLRALLALEQAQDRQRPYPNAPRTLDLDLLWHGGVERQSPDLILPHPRMAQRAFVLVPLAEVLQTLATSSRPGAAQGGAKAAGAQDVPVLPPADARALMAAAQGLVPLGPW